MSTYYTFSDDAISAAMQAAQATHENSNLGLRADFDTTKGGSLSVHAECISVTVENHKICLNLPLGFGKHCISIPVKIPNGTAGKACLHICTTWGIPTGIRVTVEIGGVTVVSQTFGKC